MSDTQNDTAKSQDIPAAKPNSDLFDNILKTGSPQATTVVLQETEKNPLGKYKTSNNK